MRIGILAIFMKLHPVFFGSFVVGSRGLLKLVTVIFFVLINPLPVIFIIFFRRFAIASSTRKTRLTILFSKPKSPGKLLITHWSLLWHKYVTCSITSVLCSKRPISNEELARRLGFAKENCKPG